MRDVGKALGLPQSELDRLAKRAGWAHAATRSRDEMARTPEFAGKPTRRSGAT